MSTICFTTWCDLLSLFAFINHFVAAVDFVILNTLNLTRPRAILSTLISARCPVADAAPQYISAYVNKLRAMLLESVESGSRELVGDVGKRVLRVATEALAAFKQAGGGTGPQAGGGTGGPALGSNPLPLSDWESALNAASDEYFQGVFHETEANIDSVQQAIARGLPKILNEVLKFDEVVLQVGRHVLETVQGVVEYHKENIGYGLVEAVCCSKDASRLHACYACSSCGDGV
jgi:hypothetical protein